MSSTPLHKWTAAVYWFCIIFLIVGGFVVAMGIWTSLQSVLAELVSVVPFSFIVIGCFVFLVSFMGWYSSRKEDKKLLLVYNVMLVLSFLAVFGLSVGTYVADIKKIEQTLYASWVIMYAEQGENSPTLHKIEQEFRCCGFYNATHLQVPTNCLEHIRDASDGCYEILHDTMEIILHIVFGIGMAAGGIQVVGSIFAILAYKEAPTQRELDSLLSEEARRLNDSWTVPSTSTSVQKN